MINCFRSSNKSPYFYFLNQIHLSSIKNIQKSKIFQIVISTPISLFQFYYQHHEIHSINFDIKILKEQTLRLYTNLSFILQDHLHTNLNSFTVDFRHHLSKHKLNISRIDSYIKINSLTHINNPEISEVTETPVSPKATNKSSFYPRYT